MRGSERWMVTRRHSVCDRFVWYELKVLRRPYRKFFIHLSYITPLCNTSARILTIRIDSDWLKLTNVDKYRLLSIVTVKYSKNIQAVCCMKGILLVYSISFTACRSVYNSSWYKNAMLADVIVGLKSFWNWKPKANSGICNLIVSPSTKILP